MLENGDFQSCTCLPKVTITIITPQTVVFYITLSSFSNLETIKVVKYRVNLEMPPNHGGLAMAVCIGRRTPNIHLSSNIATIGEFQIC